MSLRVEVQRWPAVPTAPNTAPITVILTSAFGDTIMALFPPSSRSDFPRRSATVFATILPMRVDPVAETSGILLSVEMSSPMEAPPVTRQEMPSGKLFSRSTSAMMFWQAMPQSGVFSDGFQMQTSPQTQASAEFQDQTATGKLKADITPPTPSGWYWSYMRWPGRSECIV